MRRPSATSSRNASALMARAHRQCETRGDGRTSRRSTRSKTRSCRNNSLAVRDLHAPSRGRRRRPPRRASAPLEIIGAIALRHDGLAPARSAPLASSPPPRTVPRPPRSFARIGTSSANRDTRARDVLAAREAFGTGGAHTPRRRPPPNRRSRATSSATACVSATSPTIDPPRARRAARGTPSAIGGATSNSPASEKTPVIQGAAQALAPAAALAARRHDAQFHLGDGGAKRARSGPSNSGCASRHATETRETRVTLDGMVPAAVSDDDHELVGSEPRAETPIYGQSSPSPSSTCTRTRRVRDRLPRAFRLRVRLPSRWTGAFLYRVRVLGRRLG